MPTRRFSTMSMRPQPYDPMSWLSKVMMPSMPSGSPSTEVGLPCSNPITTSRGSVAVWRVSIQTPGGGTAPEVVVDRVHLLLGGDDRDVVAVRVEDRLLAGHAPAPHRCEHLEVGRQ